MDRRCSDWINYYISYTENTEPAQLYRKGAAISTIASVLQRKCYLLWGREKFYPNFYIILVGPSGARKSVAMGQALKFLLDERLDVVISVPSTTTAGFIDIMCDSKRTHINPNTLEETTHSSITVLASELAVFLGQRDIQLLQDLCDLYDTSLDPWIHHTVGRGSKQVFGPCVNLLGGIPPKLLRDAVPLEIIGGGLLGRMMLLFSWDKEKKVVDDEETPEEKYIRECLCDDLYTISKLSGSFTLTPEVIEVDKEFYLNFDPNTECKDDRFEPYFSRKRMLQRKLSMVMSASRGDSMTIIPEDYLSAQVFLSEVEERMYLALSGVGKYSLADIMDRVMRFIAVQKKCKLSELMYRFRDDVSKYDLLNIVDALATMRYCKYFENTQVLEFNEEFDPSLNGNLK